VELWRSVVGYEDRYQISNLGRVWSIRSNKIMKTPIGNHGYPVVNLTGKGSKQQTRCVHELVLTAFVKPCPEGMEACHGELGRACPYLSNLSWGTRSKNNGEDKLRDGKHNRGERQGQSKLTGEQVLEIRERYVPYEVTMQQLADEYGVSLAQIWRIIHELEWAYEKPLGYMAAISDCMSLPAL
jgi:hypothetical protein